jgi:hypothetical protein
MQRGVWTHLRQGKQARLEQELPKDRQRTHLTADEREIVGTDDPRWIAVEEQVISQHDAIDAACDSPTTIAGCAALLSYAAEFVRTTGDEWPNKYKYEGEAGCCGWLGTQTWS